MKVTRYAIWIDRSTIPHFGYPARYWHCQGLPNDPSDFGFAILYASEERAKKAMTGRVAWMQKYATIVPIDCEFTLPV